MEKRTSMRKDSTLSLLGSGGEKKAFTIDKKVDDGGGSCVCYVAHHAGSGAGTLKEFYPKGLGLKRERTKQLICGDPAKREDMELEKELYLEPYRRLIEIRKAPEKAERLNFIPSLELLYSDVPVEKVGTAYIWTPEPKCTTFEEICRENRATDSKGKLKNPEYRLALTLCAIQSLSEGVRILHEENFIYRDVKPSNFGFSTRSGKVQYQDLSIFDLNSLCVTSGQDKAPMGTEGFLEPEARGQAGGYEVTNQTDLYAIGATLLYALIDPAVLEKETNRYGYETDRKELEKLLTGSGLLSAASGSKVNQNKRLREDLLHVLSKCLCSREDRYRSCEELEEDLKAVLDYLGTPEQLSGKKKKELEKLEKDFPKAWDEGAAATKAIQRHLYQVPLYRGLSGEEKKDGALRVVIDGFGIGGQSFLDACLQLGQVFDRLQVTVLGKENEQKQYLDARSELKKFFAINGEKAQWFAEGGSGDPYGTIQFLFPSQKEGKRDKRLMEEIKEAHYIFIDRGSDGENLAAARLCLPKEDRENAGPVISFLYRKEKKWKKTKGLYPIPLEGENDPDIERMALNVHMLWNTNLYQDYAKVRREFRDPGNYKSSVGNVLSIKYKLYQLGIDLDSLSPEEAAARAQEALAKDEKLRDRLVWQEHKRWVTEKLCQGWTQKPLDETCLEENGRQDKTKHIHICMVPSTPGQKLKTSKEYWDTKSLQEVENELDPLDQLSVKLHRMFRDKAEEKRLSQRLEDMVGNCPELLQGSRKAISAFREWYSCMQGIWQGERQKVRLYKGLKDKLLECVEEELGEDGAGAKKAVDNLHKAFYPILENLRRQSWKELDVTLVDGIPYILTHTTQTALLVPLALGDNSTAFRNVAAATVIDPVRIRYLYELEGRHEIKPLERALTQALNYISHKSLRAKTELILLCRKEEEAPAKEIQAWGKKSGLDRVEIWALESPEELPLRLESYLDSRRIGDTEVTDLLEWNRTGIAERLKEFYPWYRFDPRNKVFRESSGCEMLRYLNTEPYYITVTDMAALNDSYREKEGLPDFETEYKELWELYREDTYRWKSLCDLLKRYHQRQSGSAGGNGGDKIAFLPRTEEDAVPYTYVVPEDRKEITGKILRLLKDNGVIAITSSAGKTRKGLTVTIYPKLGKKEDYDAIFTGNKIAVSDDITLIKEEDGTPVAQFASAVEMVCLHDPARWDESDFEKRHQKNRKKLLQMLRAKGYIRNGLTFSEKGGILYASFNYAFPEARDLLTTEGRILEIFLYQAARNSGKFDDVAGSYELYWGNTEVKNEIDCVITKGFRSLFIECKAQKDLKSEFYYKLDSLFRTFAVNGTAVLVADTQEGGTAGNKLFNERGKMMDIVTLFQDDLLGETGDGTEKIVTILEQILDGTYSG